VAAVVAENREKRAGLGEAAVRWRPLEFMLRVLAVRTLQREE
jgi:hypothetical protein